MENRMSSSIYIYSEGGGRVKKRQYWKIQWLEILKNKERHESSCLKKYTKF